MLCCVPESFGISAPVDEFVREKPALGFAGKTLAEARVLVSGTRRVGGGLDGGAAIGTRMNNDFKSRGWMYHGKDVGPKPGIRSSAPPARRAGKPGFA